MSDPEASQITRSISDNENTHHSRAQPNDDVGSLRLNPNSTRRLEGVHSIAVNPSATLSAERMSLAGIPEGINEFFTDDDGQSFLEGIHHPAALKRTKTLASQLYSHRPFSTPSITTVIFCGVCNMSVPQLCDFVKQHRSLRRAEILSTQCYTEFNGRVVHRFLILELHREGRKDIWLRLDRRPGQSTWQLLRAVGKAPAKDTAQLAVVKEDLIGSASLENRQVFETAPTLGELQYFLSVVCDELTVYKAWPENCYFYCSLIQEHLGAEGEGIFSKGKLPYADLAQEIRGRVQERVRLFYHMPAPFTLSSLLTSLSENGLSCDNALDLSRQWDSLKSAGSVGSHKLADKLERALRPVGETLLSTSQFVESVTLSQLTRELWRSLDRKGQRTTVSPQYHDNPLQRTQQFNDANEVGNEDVHISPSLHGRDREEYCKRLSLSLYTYGISLRGARQFDDACKAAAEAVALSRRLYERDREQYCEHLSDILYEYGYSLREAQRFDDACKVGTEDVALSRHLYDRDPNQYRKSLVGSLCLYGVSLQDARRFGEACKAGAEYVSLSRHLYDRDPNHCGELALSLSHYCLALQKAKRFDEACKVGAESVALYHPLYDRDPNQYGKHLALSLHCYGASLQKTRRFNEACRAGAEVVTLFRHLYDRDPNQYCEELALSLSHHCLALQKAKRFDEACKAGAESVDFSRRLYGRDPDRYCEGLHNSLWQHGILLQNDRQFDNACDVLAEAAALIDSLYERGPDQYRHKLAIVLCCYDNILRKADRFDDARTVARRHFVLFHQLYHTEAALDSWVAEYIHEHYGTPPQQAEDRRG